MPATELIDVLDERGLPTGEVKPRDAVHRDGDWHRCLHLWVTGPDGVLLQRRAATKDSWPGYLDASAAGHLTAGETWQDALREAHEELGLDVGPDDVRVLGERPLSDRPRPGMVNREHQVVAHVHDPRPLAAWAPGLDRVELAGLVALPLPAFTALAARTEPGPWRGRAVDLDGHVAEVDVRVEEVLAGGYLPVLAIMLERLAAGLEPVAV